MLSHCPLVRHVPVLQSPQLTVPVPPHPSGQMPHCFPSCSQVLGVQIGTHLPLLHSSPAGQPHVSVVPQPSSALPHVPAVGNRAPHVLGLHVHWPPLHGPPPVQVGDCMMFCVF